MKYTEQEITSIVKQLRAIKINDRSVFLAWVDDTETVYHTIFLDSGMGIQTLEFEKAPEPQKPHILATLERGTTEWLARILEPGKTPHYFVPHGKYAGIPMNAPSFLELAIEDSYPGVEFVDEDTFNQAAGIQGEG